MDVVEVLRESFLLLRRQPMAFFPRIVTTALYSIYTVYSMWLAADLFYLTDPSLVAVYLTRVALLFALMPPLYFVDILSYAMYPRIVQDYESGRPIGLWRALLGGLRAWKVVVALGFVLLMFLVLTLFIVLGSGVASILSGSPLFIVLAFLIIVVILLLFSVVVFFVVPAAIVEGKGVVESFKESFRLGFEHRRDLIALNLVFLALVLVTMALVFFARSDTFASWASIALFIFLRLVEAVVYTYLAVTNPVAYMRVRINKTPTK